MRRVRTLNVSHYKWHVRGMLAGEPIDKKYVSMQAFLREHGGDKSPLNLDRHKVSRFRTNQTHPMWQLTVKAIKEKRQCRTVYLDC